MRSVSDEKEIKRAKAQASLDDKTNAKIVTVLMSTREGRRWSWLRLSEAKIFHSTIAWGIDGYAITAFNEGQRAAGLRLLSDIVRLSPKEFVLMMEENSNTNLSEEPSDDRYDPNPTG